MFAFNSVGSIPEKQINKPYISQLSLRNIDDEKQMEINKAIEEINLDCSLGRGLLRRTMGNFTIINNNIDVFIKTAIKKLDDEQRGNHIGTLLAGAYSLQSSSYASDEDALEFMNQFDWTP